MKKNYFILTIASLLMVAFVCCKSNTKKGGNDNNADSNAVKEKSNDASQNAGKRYLIKSAIINMTGDMQGMKMNYIHYFDEYGEKDATETNMEMMGMKMHTVSITKDGYIYVIDLTKKMGTKTKIQTADANHVNFNDIPKDLEKDMNIKKEGTEDFLGKTCDKYSMDYTKTGMKGTYLVWKGIPLKSVMEMSGVKTTMEATKVEEDAKISADKFEIPSDVKITEVKPENK